MTFDQWLTTGPLASEPLTERERILLNLGFLGGQEAAYSKNIAALDRILKSHDPAATPQGAS